MRILLALGFGTALFVSSALAGPPGPKYWGDIYIYYNAQGQQVGRASIDCNTGELHRSGIATQHYTYAQATC